MSGNAWIVVPLVAIAVTQATGFATSIYLHRTLAHRALALHPVVDIFFRALLWLTTGQIPKEWVAVHRKHHAFTDQPGDPHSPYLLGFWRVQLFNVYYYWREARNPVTVEKFAPDITEDRLDRAIFSWGYTGVALGTGLLCLVLGLWPGIITMVLHGVVYIFVLAPLINGLSHWRGTQNFVNTAYNQRVLAWVTAGENLHNNHHAYPRAPKFSMRRFEFDPAWPLIRGLVALRLAAVIGQRADLHAGAQRRPA